MRIAFCTTAFFAFLCLLGLQADASVFTFTLKHNQPLSAQVLEEVPKSFLITSIVNSLPQVTVDDIQYLFSFKTPVLVDKNIFLTGVERLKMQLPVSDITLALVKRHDGYELRVGGEQQWMIGRISYKGMNFAREEYGILYDGLPGEYFSLERHTQALEAIKKSAQKKGYLDAQVDAHVEYKKKEKVVDICISVFQKQLYKIGSVDLIFDQSLSKLSYTERDKLYKKFFSGMVKRPYDTNMLELSCKEIKQYLSELGCTGSTVQIEEKSNQQDKTVALTSTLGCQQQRELQFFGNHFFSTDELRALIMRFGNEAGILPPLVMCQEMQEAYHKKGFWQVQVDTHQDETADYFIIKEGSRARIGAVYLHGTHAYSSKYLVATFFKKTVVGSMVDEGVLEKAVDTLIEWYKESGYTDVVLLQKEFKPTAHKDQFDLVLSIDEGPQYQVTSVVVQDMPEELASLAAGLVPVCPFPVSFAKIQQSKKKLMHVMRTKGYIHAQVTTSMVLTGTDYALTFNAQPGSLVRVGKCLVTGTTKTDHAVVRGLMAAQEGSVWNSTLLPLSFNYLKTTDVFERITLHPVTVGQNQERDILVVLQDEEPFECKVRLGYEQLSKNFAFKKGSSYTAGGSFVWRNPTGKADRIICDVDTSRFERKVGLAYKTPFLGTFPVTTTLKTYANKYTQPVAIGSIHPLYNITQEGFLCGFTKHFTHYDTGVTTGFEWMLMNNISEKLSRAINFKPTLIGQKIPYFFAEPMVYIDYVDNRLTPTQGMFTALTLKGMFPLHGEGSYFVKGLIEQGWFVPMQPFIWATRIRIGHIFKQEFNAVMPSERFYLGGPNSLRGYQVDKCPPLGSFIDDKNQLQWLQQGGKTMLNFNMELRFPLIIKMLKGVVFQDFGVLVERPQDLLALPDKPLAATGFGLRYITPIGPFRFDIGWKWHKDRPDDPAYAWFLTFDHMF